MKLRTPRRWTSKSGRYHGWLRGDTLDLDTDSMVRLARDNRKRLRK